MSTVMSVLSAVFVILTGATLLVGCEAKPEAPPRLPGISPTAVWAGWIDGGAWIECWFDPQANANWCSAWNDQTGEVIARTHYVLRATGVGVLDHELTYRSFGGVHLELQDGRVLEPVRRTPKDEPAIEQPRKRPVQ